MHLQAYEVSIKVALSVSWYISDNSKMAELNFIEVNTREFSEKLPYNSFQFRLKSDKNKGDFA
jgi:hypothetical protein